MNAVLIESTKFSPEVLFDKNKGIITFTGKLYPANSTEFFNPIHEMIIDYIQNHPEITLVFKLTYINSSATKLVLRLFEELSTYYENGKKVQVDWFHDEMDDDMIEVGEDISELVNLPIKIQCL
jgi:hypothetical protein